MSFDFPQEPFFIMILKNNLGIKEKSVFIVTKYIIEIKHAQAKLKILGFQDYITYDPEVMSWINHTNPN